MVENGCPQPRKKDGGRCQGKPGPDGYCMSHSPSLEQKRQGARRKGGYGKARTARAKKFLLDEFQTWSALIDRAAAETYKGDLPPNVASALASLAGAKVKFYETSLRLWEASEAQERIKALEEKLNDLNLKGSSNGAYRGAVHR
jgi:hypothetical protein